MSNKFLEFMKMQSKYGNSAYFLDEFISNNSGISSNTNEVLSIAEKIQDDFRVSCHQIIEINNFPELSDWKKEEKRKNINAKLLSNIAYTIDESVSIEPSSEIDTYTLSQKMIEKVFNPMVDNANEINSIINRGLTI